ncbi:MAG: aminopeptidase P N-terminal domain-containing protein, partial [Saprospiraceae bacterium]|nr:aminopeptidase P N-terminal domain-containing protein [Saprospiraceae bacterium]
MFGKDTYLHRRKTLLQGLGNGLILLLGNEESSKNYLDNTYRFRQDSNFLYYVGWDRPHLAAILDTETG